MAAVGLKPDRASMLESEESSSQHLAILAEFAFAMKAKLQNINENSYNNFILRVGGYFKSPVLLNFLTNIKLSLV